MITKWVGSPSKDRRFTEFLRETIIEMKKYLSIPSFDEVVGFDHKWSLPDIDTLVSHMGLQHIHTIVQCIDDSGDRKIIRTACGSLSPQKADETSRLRILLKIPQYNKMVGNLLHDDLLRVYLTIAMRRTTNHERMKIYTYFKDWLLCESLRLQNSDLPKAELVSIFGARLKSYAQKTKA